MKRGLNYVPAELFALTGTYMHPCTAQTNATRRCQPEQAPRSGFVIEAHFSRGKQSWMKKTEEKIMVRKAVPISLCAGTLHINQKFFGTRSFSSSSTTHRSLRPTKALLPPPHRQACFLSGTASRRPFHGVATSLFFSPL